jgi:hypothetical protein
MSAHALVGKTGEFIPTLRSFHKQMYITSHHRQAGSIERKILQWHSHVKRMPEKRIPKLIMEWIPGERRKRGR